MLKALIKVRFISLFKTMFTSSGKQKKYVKVLIALLMVYGFGSICVSVGIMFSSLAVPLSVSDLSWLYFAIAGIAGFCLAFIGSVFSAETQLFEAKDNELLLSMPFSATQILIARMTALMTLNVIFEVLMAVPAGVVYIMNVGIKPLGFILFILSLLSMSFLVMALSCLLGWLLAFILSKVKNRSFIMMFFYILIMAGYFKVYGSINKYIQAIISNGDTIAASIKKALPVFYYLGDASANGNILSFFKFLLICVIPFVLVVFVLSRSYISVMINKKARSHKAYKAGELKTSGAFSALLHKEIKFFLGRPMYIMNAGTGIIFMVVIAVGAVVKQDYFLTAIAGFGIPDTRFVYPYFVIGILTMCVSMVFISAPSISLEGKNLWIVKSIPVPSATVLKAKIASHIVICLPFIVVSSVIMAIFLRMRVDTLLLSFLLPLGVTVFCAVFGVFINLKFPKFDWINEVTVVKQSLSVMLTMLASLILIIMPLFVSSLIVINLFSGYLPPLLFAFFVYTLILSAVFYSVLMKKAEKRFFELQ
ncbi:MAG: hypothetical protein K6F09_01060 [Clostridiales bacterium]|nr:hypothetical protein [Clostridiales bacterium]